MGFFDSFLAWLVLIIIISFLLFAIFSYFLGWFYPNEKRQIQRCSMDSEEEQQMENQQRQRKWVGIFILIAMIIIMGTTGANAFINQKEQ